MWKSSYFCSSTLGFCLLFLVGLAHAQEGQDRPLVTTWTGTSKLRKSQISSGTELVSQAGKVSLTLVVDPPRAFLILSGHLAEGASLPGFTRAQDPLGILSWGLEIPLRKDGDVYRLKEESGFALEPFLERRGVTYPVALTSLTLDRDFQPQRMVLRPKGSPFELVVQDFKSGSPAWMSQLVHMRIPGAWSDRASNRGENPGWFEWIRFRIQDDRAGSKFIWLWARSSEIFRSEGPGDPMREVFGRRIKLRSGRLGAGTLNRTWLSVGHWGDGGLVNMTLTHPRLGFRSHQVPFSRLRLTMGDSAGAYSARFFSLGDEDPCITSLKSISK